MSIRQMNIADLEQVTGLYEAANPFSTREAIRRWTMDGLRDHPDLNLVWIPDREITGAISGIRMNAEEVTINDVGVRESARGKGIGKSLIEALLQRAASAERITLCVHRENARAMELYARLGFTQSGTTLTQGIDGVPDGKEIILMVRDRIRSSTQL